MSISERQLFKEVCENDFSFFCKQYLKVVEPETAFEWNWHLDVICHQCEMVYYGHTRNLDIQIPPRMLKSLIVSILFPAWVWTKKPSTKFICASRSMELSVGFNTKRRDLILSDEYQNVWTIVIRDDQNKDSKFVNYHNGFMHAVSAEGKVTGAGGDILISDDLLDAMDAFSKAKRTAVNTWFSQAFYGRAQNKKNVRRININQRLHKDDPSGNIQKNHNYDTLILEMVKTENNRSTVDYVDPRQPKELLFPSRYSEKELADDKKALGSYGYSAQMQQNPIPIGGGMIKEEWIRYWTVLPDNFDEVIITGDLTFKGEDTSDYVSFMIWGKKGNIKYLVKVVRGKWTYRQTKIKFKQFVESHPDVGRKWIEDKANGPALISDLSDNSDPNNPGITGLKAWPEKGSPYVKLDKVGRLGLCSDQFELGEVYLPKDDEITKELVVELTSFTENGSATGNDDMVDTTTMALLELKKSEAFFSA